MFEGLLLSDLLAVAGVPDTARPRTSFYLPTAHPVEAADAT